MEISALVNAIKVFDEACGGNVILSPCEQAMEQYVICIKDRELFEKVAKELGLFAAKAEELGVTEEEVISKVGR
jgi:hypothetical protein